MLILLVGGLAAAWQSGVFRSSESNTSSSGPEATNVVDYGPPTEEEQKAGDNVKESVTTENTGTNTQPGNKSVNVIITDATQYDSIIEVRSFVPNHIEDGVCTITFTKGAETLQKTANAFADASTSICTNPTIERSEFSSAGTWNLVVAYNSKTATGKSEAREVIIK